MAASTSYHEPLEKLTSTTQDLHRALTSVQEELEAVDWYRQRADSCEDAELREILLHNMREEIEHASMLLEWLRRRDADFAAQFRTYLFSEKPIVEVEEEEAGETTGRPESSERGSLTIGSLKGA